MFVVGAHTETALWHEVFMAAPTMPLHTAAGHLLQRGAVLLLISLYKQGLQASVSAPRAALPQQPLASPGHHPLCVG